jgi:hypothetical protein
MQKELFNLLEELNIPESEEILGKSEIPSNKEIEKTESILSLRFAEDFKEYLSMFGHIYIKNIEIATIVGDTGIDIINMTKKVRCLNNRLPIDLYAIANMGINNIYYLQNQQGCVYIIYGNSEPIKVANSLYEFLKNYNLS